MLILAPSMLAADFTRLGEEIRTIAEEGAQYIHFFRHSCDSEAAQLC